MRDKPIIRSSNDIRFYCECGYVLRITIYPVDLTKDTIELDGCTNPNCKWKDRNTIVEMEKRKVVYIEPEKIKERK